ncbi:lipase maturation factor family protein [Geomonas paludis]|uniref:Lipase maturation factor family protein n=1 Tax=Geomonas paludis TaxID=2740185 RepID=A0A6V8N1U6_9BACT|nr:lipase maturation factor family protein [Geomonas paludis]UPU34753.1 lipase maturation factor family protein [Geomonas paludis]GFO66381.1 membrane protein [Geomonas paludis]
MSDDGYWIIRLMLLRGLGVIYLMGFLVACNQFRALCGDRGLEPALPFMRLVPFRDAPSLFYFVRGDHAYLAIALSGVLLSLAAVTGLSDAGGTLLSMTVWFLLWVFYLSFVNIGQTFYAFGWESLLLEAGFLAVFLGPSGAEPSWAVIWLYRWLAFRIMFGAGMIKLRGDSCWHDLTCLDYHFETQPMPNPLSRLFHRLPAPVHKAGVLFNHLAELVLPFLFFLPQPVAGIAAAGALLFLLSIIVSGNFAWLNWLTAVICFSPLDGSFIANLLDVRPGPMLPQPPLFQALTWGVVLLVAAKSVEPARNLFSKRQIMNTSFDPFHLVNTYGAFGSITRERYEIVLEGTQAEHAWEEAAWQAYEFRGKPGDPSRMPPFIAPYHLRLDWLMWFEAMPSQGGHSRWFVHLVIKLLQGDQQTLALLRHNPFPDAPPRFIRALYYRYNFGDKQWWRRELVGEYLVPVSLEHPVLKQVLERYQRKVAG